MIFGCIGRNQTHDIQTVTSREQHPENNNQPNEEYENENQPEVDTASFVLHGPWPPKIYKYLAVKDRDTWSFIAEVIASTGNEEARVTVFEKVHPDGYDGYSLWKDDDERTISRQSVLPTRPQTSAIPLLTVP